jgi:subtilisin family serine protease
MFTRTSRYRTHRRTAPIALLLVLGLAASPATAQEPAPSADAATQQWALGAINAAPAWAVPAADEVIVAVLDSGIDVTHPALAANLWHNPKPTVGDVNGYNVLTRTGDVGDDWGHGTEVAGIIGAAPASAGSAISGVAPRARLMAVKVLDRHGRGSTASVVAGMRYALRHGARVINLSLTGPDRSRALEQQIRAAQDAGVFVVSAAGNYGNDVVARPAYPAAYRQPNLIGVASVGPEGLSEFSNRGGPISLAAPGEDVLTTARGAGYVSMYGTSAAAPQVSGALALMTAARPDATNAQLRAALEGSARRLPALAGKVQAGLLDVGAAMTRLLAQPRLARSARARAALRSRAAARRRASA